MDRHHVKGAFDKAKGAIKDAAGKTTNGDTEPTTLASSAFDKVMEKVGKDFGWHIFGMFLLRRNLPSYFLKRRISNSGMFRDR